MKWYKFIIWVQLFLMALFSFANAVLLFSGGHYQGEADLVYSVFPDLKPIDTVFAIPFLALGAFCIVVRQELASFKRQGPSHYYILYGAAIAVQLLYIIVASGVLGDLAADAGTWTGITMSVVMIIANKVYFDKRAFLFRN